MGFRECSMENMVEKFLFNGIYKNKKVLITGHTGFKGSWLTQWLHLMGAKLYGISKEIFSEPDHFSNLNIDMKSIIGDIRDYNFIERQVNLFKPDIIFHLAAQPIVKRSIENPIETFDTNLIGTLNLFEACRRNKISRIINVTSDKVYYNNEMKKNFTEVDKLGGNGIYSSSKACVEIMTSAYRKTYFNTNDTLIINVRSGNIIGGGDWGESRLIPDIMRSLTEKKDFEVRNPNSVRPWQHVLSALSGYLILGEKLLNGSRLLSYDWNFGPLTKNKFSVRKILKIFQTEWPELRVKNALNKFNESKHLMIDSNLAREEIGWNEVWDVKQSIEKTISWYKSFFEKNQIETKKQILDFINDSEKKSMAWATK